MYLLCVLTDKNVKFEIRMETDWIKKLCFLMIFSSFYKIKKAFVFYIYIEESVDYMLHVNREVFLEPNSMTKLELD